jgi:hypothetical protein
MPSTTLILRPLPEFKMGSDRQQQQQQQQQQRHHRHRLFDSV